MKMTIWHITTHFVVEGHICLAQLSMLYVEKSAKEIKYGLSCL